MFAPGARPSADAVAALGRRTRGFTISHRPADEEGWLELLVNGLTFDVRGLAPAPPAEPFGFAHRFAVAEQHDPESLEALSLTPGAHLAGAEAMLPVVRAAAGLAAELGALPSCRAIGWRPARTLSGTDHFTRTVESWIAGGAFPALGLTALARSSEGGLRSEGLAFLIGRELVLAPGGAPAVEDAKLATRLIDRLVKGVPGDYTGALEALPGVWVTMTDDCAQKLIRVERGPAKRAGAR